MYEEAKETIKDHYILWSFLLLGTRKEATYGHHDPQTGRAF